MLERNLLGHFSPSFRLSSLSFFFLIPQRPWCLGDWLAGDSGPFFDSSCTPKLKHVSWFPHL